MKTRKEISEEFQCNLKITKSKLSRQYRNTKKCRSFYAGDFMDYEDSLVVKDGVGRQKRTMVKFNKIKPYVNSVKGFMSQNRRIQKYEARIQDSKVQQLFSNYANGIARYVRENGYADQVESQQNGDLLVNGYGAVETAMSYGDGYLSNAEYGQIIYGRIDPLSVGWDPFARATNILDARWVYAIKEFSLDDAKLLFDEEDPQVFEAASQEENSSYEYFPNGGLYDKIAPYDYVDEKENRVRVYFYQWYDIENYYKSSNPINDLESQEAIQLANVFMEGLSSQYDDFDGGAELLTFNGEIKNLLKNYFGDLLGELFEFKSKVFYTAIISGDHVFTKYKSLSQEGFTLQFKTGDYDAVNDIWVGMVNPMMEPSLYYNKALTELMFTIASNSKGGVYVEDGAVEDIAEFEDRYSKTDAVIHVNEGAISGGKILEKKSPHISTGLEEIVTIADNALPDVSGIDSSFLGSREFANDTFAYQRARIKRVTATLAHYFDSANLYLKVNSRILLDMMKVFVENNEDRIVRIIGKDGKAFFVKLSEKQLSAEFDISIEESPLSTEDKQEQSTLLSSMGDKIGMTDPTTAKIIYGLAVDLMPLDKDKKEKVLEVLQPKEKEIDPAYVQQLEAQVKEFTDARSEAQLNNIIADAESKLARAQEIRAKAIKINLEAENVDIEGKKTMAETAKILEDARSTSLESDVIANKDYDEAVVVI